MIRIRYRRICSASTLIGTFVCLLSSNFTKADQSPFPTNATLRHMREIEDPRLSPDGRQVLYRILDSTADGGQAHLYLLDIEQNQSTQLTTTLSTDARGDHDAVWAHDGQSILFLAKRGSYTQLHTIFLRGGEAQPTPIQIPVVHDHSRLIDVGPMTLDTMPEEEQPVPADVLAFRGSAQAGRLIFIARNPQTSREKALIDAKADAIAVDQERHRTGLYILDNAEHSTIARPLDLSTACADCDVADFDWSPDESQIVVVLKNSGRADDVTPQISTWIFSADGKNAPQRLTAVPPTGGQVVWSADGARVIYTGQSGINAPPGYAALYATDLSNGKNHVWVETEHTPTGRPFPLQDGSVVVQVEHGLDRTLVKYTFDQATPGEWALPVTNVDAFDATDRGIVFVGSASGTLPALYYAQSFGQPVQRLTSQPVSSEPISATQAQRISWRHEGRQLQGLLYLPTRTPAHPIPLILEVHGGPLGAYVDQFDPFVEFLLGQGWAVLRTNPRGSTGRGPAFAAANQNDLGGGDYRDIMSGVDWVIAHAPIDKSRLAMIGYSYGGEMAGFIAGRTDRFKAIVSGAPVIDQFSEYGTEDGSWYDRWYFGKPWEHMADAWRQSPLSTVGRARTPFLLLQGEADVTDPIGQSQEMYRALRQMGVKVELITYPREDHGPLARGLYGRSSPEPWHGYDARRRLTQFIREAFERH